MSNGSLLITMVSVASYDSSSFFFTVSQSLQSSLPFTSVNNTQSQVCVCSIPDIPRNAIAIVYKIV